jgi:hypothetical protein
MTVVHRVLGPTLFVLSATAAHAGPARACVDESERLVGERAVLIGKDGPFPRRLGQAAIEFPTRQGTSKALSTIWLGDALVDRDGKVRGVWTVRPLRFEPAWPEMEQAILAGVRQMTYEPFAPDGTRTAFCVTVSVNLDF